MRTLKEKTSNDQLTIGILNAYHFDSGPGNGQEDYSRLCMDFASRTFASQTIKEYKVALAEWPLNFDECSVWIVTGSVKGAYEKLEWITKLQQLIRDLHLRQKKIIGICFGHQLVAHALGAKVEKSPKGWGVGVRTLSVVRQQPWMTPRRSEMSLLFSHQDQVMTLPEGAILLAEDDFCPVQMLQIGNNILTFQGHPELSVDFARERLISRRERMPKETFDKAMESYSKLRDHEILSGWVRNFCVQN